MKPLGDPDIHAFCAAAGVLLERLDEFDNDTVRITLTGPIEFRGIASKDVQGESGPFVLIGRERNATLANINDGEAQRLFPTLVSHRSVLIDDGIELALVLETLARLGWCVDNDAYAFPSDGRWIVYVGHDEGIIQYKPKSH